MFCVRAGKIARFIKRIAEPRVAAHQIFLHLLAAKLVASNRRAEIRYRLIVSP